MAKFTIVGAGIVGICTGLYLQWDGHDVTLVDPQPPASGCSRGNGGLIQAAACVPIATPGVLRAVPRMLLDPDQPLMVHWRHLPRLAPYLGRFLAAARPQRVEEISRALAALISLAVPSYRPLIEQAGAGSLVQRKGELHIFASRAAFRAAHPSHELRRRRGLRVEVLDAQELHRMEPALDPSVRYAVWLPEPLQTLDPYDFACALAARFVQNGGRLLQEKVEELVVEGRLALGIRTSTATYPVDQLVIAAGAHSKPLAESLGSFVPLDTERGYHLMLPQPKVTLQVPLMSGDYRFALIQMTGGLRLVGTAELGRLDMPPNYRRAHRLLELAQRILPGLSGEGAEPWMGQRPSTPDSLPVICRAPHCANAYFAFGHGHLGLTLAAATGRLVADLVAGRTSPIAMDAFHVSRYRRGVWL